MRSSLLWKQSKRNEKDWNATHLTRFEKDETTRSKQRPSYWQWRRSFILGDSNWHFFQVGYPVATSHFAATPQWRSAHMCTWFSASWRRFRYDRKCAFSYIYNLQITISPTSLFSANFNGNRVNNHPQPWTCPLTKGALNNYYKKNTFKVLH